MLGVNLNGNNSTNARDGKGGADTAADPWTAGGVIHRIKNHMKPLETDSESTDASVEGVRGTDDMSSVATEDLSDFSRKSSSDFDGDESENVNSRVSREDSGSDQSYRSL